MNANVKSKLVQIPIVEVALLKIASDKGIQTGRDRLAAMKPQCGFGELGTCCRICYMGPCRIDPFGNGTTYSGDANLFLWKNAIAF